MLFYSLLVGYSLLAINGEPVTGRKYKNIDVLEDFLKNEDNYPLNLKFGLPRLTTNEKIIMASMFHSMYAIASLQIVPKTSQPCTGIDFMETNNFRLNCFHTSTGVKFILIGDCRDKSNKDALLRKIYELYSDYVLKNPFYQMDMPIRCELFDANITLFLDAIDRSIPINDSGDRIL